MVARHLEANGIPTVVLGSAKDIVEYCRVPRFYFVDFPLGNPCGEPYNREQQREIVHQALGMLTVTQPAETIKAPFEWRTQTWRENYMQVRPEDLERLKAAGERRKRERQSLRDQGKVRSE